jgi:hypothetical protein
MLHLASVEAAQITVITMLREAVVILSSRVMKLSIPVFVNQASLDLIARMSWLEAVELAQKIVGIKENA